MARSIRRLAAAALAVALLGSSGPAYVLRRASTGSGITWNLSSSAANVVGGKVTFYVDQASAVDVTGAQFATAVRAAVQSWEDVEGSAIAFTEDSSRPSTVKSSSDRINRFGFTAGTLPAFVFASAFTATVNNRISDVDVVFNPTMDWAVVTPGDDSKADLQGVGTHEWGHGLGMDHVPLARSTMFWAASFGAIHLRYLDEDDQAGIGHAYPAAAFATDYATVQGTVDVPGTTDDRGIQVTAIDFVSGYPKGSDLTAPDGTYAIEGLPSGVYRLVASPIGTGQIANGVYSDYWDTSTTSVLPAVRGEGGAADGSTGILQLSAGQVLTGADFTLSVATNPNESNNTIGTATALGLGKSVAGRIESGGDHDVYSFPGTVGKTVSIYVQAQELGSELDPRFLLRSSLGVTLASNQDIHAVYTDSEGPDLDARLVDFTLPATDTYYVDIEGEFSPDTDRLEDFFYVLTILDGSGEASPATSEFTASPEAIDADGADTATVTFRPRGLTGTSLGAGQDVTMDLVSDSSSDGSLGGVTDNVDGTYSATLTAASSAGSDVVRALVDGTPISTVTVNYRGPVDGDASDFTAAPRRLRFDGESESTITLVPRDQNGVPFGAGHAVDITLLGSPGASVGATSDGGDGSYTATVTAGFEEETAMAAAEVDSVLMAGFLPVGIGFPLSTVVQESVAALDDALAADPPPSAKAAPKISKARSILAAVQGLSDVDDADPILAAVAKALKQLEAARKKGADAGEVLTDLAEAARESASAAMDAAEPNVSTGPEEAALAKAETLFAAGEGLLDAGTLSKAAAKYRAALKQTLKIHP